MVFVYSCIATRNQTILCEATNSESSTSETTLNSSVQECLRQTSLTMNSQQNSSKNQKNNNSFEISKKSVMNIEFHMYQSHGFLFLVATEIKQADDKAYEYLRSVQERFIALRLDSVEDQGSKLSLNKHFKTELKNIMQQYNTNRKLWNTGSLEKCPEQRVRAEKKRVNRCFLSISRKNKSFFSQLLVIF